MTKCNSNKLSHREISNFIYSLYGSEKPVGLHYPYLNAECLWTVTQCLESTFVSSVGKMIEDVEQQLASITGAKYVNATVNGTSALHLALHCLGIQRSDLVITQSLSFVATANAIKMCGADPVFIDVDRQNLGMCPIQLKRFLEGRCEKKGKQCFLRGTKRQVKAVVPMHTFGMPAHIEEIVEIARKWNLFVVEDAAESLGSTFNANHTGTFGDVGILSFNGNKIATAGGGGATITNNHNLHQRMEHIGKTAKVSGEKFFYHDELGFNYRMPALNAALLLAQLKNFKEILKNKRQTAFLYRQFFAGSNYKYIDERNSVQSNFWLNSILCKSETEKDSLLQNLHDAFIEARPIWTPLHTLPMYRDCIRDNLFETLSAYQRVVSLPSSVRELKFTND
jgi:aminotransferase in exopolysaccharide biosynthesis